MAEAEITARLLNDFRDLLQDQERVKEPADGLIYRKFTEGQMLFCETYKTTKLPLLLPLFTDQETYPIDENWVELTRDYEFSREDMNPEILLPRGGTSFERFIRINATGITEGDVLTLWGFWKPDESYRIDGEHNPVLGKAFYELLVDYALSFYRDFTVMIGDKEKRFLNPTFKTLDQVKEAVKRKRDAMYGLNSAQIIDVNVVR